MKHLILAFCELIGAGFETLVTLALFLRAIENNIDHIRRS